MTAQQRQSNNEIRETFTAEQHKAYYAARNKYISRIQCPVTPDFDDAENYAIMHVLATFTNK